MDILNKIKNLIKVARLTLIQEDDGLDTIAQVECLGKPRSVNIMYPYGVSAVAPEESTVVTMNSLGSGKNVFGIVSNPENRFKDLKEWEVKIGNYKTKAHIHFDDDGFIVLNLNDDAVSSDFMVRFSELKAGFDQLKNDFNNLVSIFNAHVHKGVTAGTASTAETLTPGTSTTASVDESKIEEIKVP